MYLKFNFKQIIILFFLLVFFIQLVQAAIIADHTIVDEYENIPQEYIDIVKTYWLNVPGESHSLAYRLGPELLYQMNSNFPAVRSEDSTPLTYRTDALRVSRSVRNQYSSWSNGIGERGWYTWHAYDESSQPSESVLIKNHIEYSNTNNYHINAIGFGWCWDMTWQNSAGGTIDPVYQVRWAGSSEGGPDGSNRWGLDSGDESLTENSVNMQDYIDATEEYIEYVNSLGNNTIVFFTTGPVDGGGNNDEEGYQRWLKHEMIRNHVINSAEQRYLFDYADILCWNNDGEQNTDDWQDHSGTTQSFQLIHSDNMMDYDASWNTLSHTEDGDHIGEVGTVRLAKAMWWLLARMAGWDGNTSPDMDSDGILNENDNCPNDANSAQQDSDLDGVGDICDGCPSDENKIVSGICGCGVADVDSDLDTIVDCNDNCPNDFNSNQANFDSDSQGDVCDLDDDNDGDPDLTDCSDNDDSIYTDATEICDGIDQNCNGNNDDDSCIDCSDGLISARCSCGSNSYISGYCCLGQYRTVECDAPNCEEGIITALCNCEFENRNSGYCCNNIYQTRECGIGYYVETFNNTDNFNIVDSGVTISLEARFSAGQDMLTDPNLISAYLFNDATDLGIDLRNNNNLGVSYGGYTNGDPAQSIILPDGKSGFSLDLDGSSSICTANSATFNPAASHTLCWWTRKKTSASGNNFARASNYDTWDESLSEYEWATNGADGWDRMYTENVFFQDSWVHICNHYDSSIGSYGGKRVFVNGVPGDTQLLTGNSMPGLGGIWCIGSYCFSGASCGAYDNSYIYEMLWFDRALSEDEIVDIYNGNYFGAGSGYGRITSNVIQSAYDISRINYIDWTETGTDVDNQIIALISADAGQHWQRANMGQAIDIIYPGSELVFDIFFNSTNSVITIDNLLIEWTEELSGETPAFVCNNSIVESGEDCDLLNLDGNNCSSIGQGFVSGVLSCNQTCGFDTSECLSVFHDADIDNSGIIELTELNNYITSWRSSSNVTLADLISAIKLWKQ